jgi:hypothetical protein
MKRSDAGARRPGEAVVDQKGLRSRFSPWRAPRPGLPCRIKDLLGNVLDRTAVAGQAVSERVARSFRAPIRRLFFGPWPPLEILRPSDHRLRSDRTEAPDGQASEIEIGDCRRFGGDRDGRRRLPWIPCRRENGRRERITVRCYGLRLVLWVSRAETVSAVVQIEAHRR